MESVHPEGVPFGRLNPPDVKNPKIGESQIHEKIGFQKFMSSIPSDVEKFAELKVPLFFKYE